MDSCGAIMYWPEGAELFRACRCEQDGTGSADDPHSSVDSLPLLIGVEGDTGSVTSGLYVHANTELLRLSESSATVPDRGIPLVRASAEQRSIVLATGPPPPPCSSSSSADDVAMLEDASLLLTHILSSGSEDSSPGVGTSPHTVKGEAPSAPSEERTKVEFDTTDATPISLLLPVTVLNTYKLSMTPSPSSPSTTILCRTPMVPT
mmetsp:Transcript_42045/g.108206  ORF Transcript_42045/g.108206 Transcript_42045/m.108206 type:complete len:206 (-) Transcript_42045:1384-2001(-)